MDKDNYHNYYTLRNDAYNLDNIFFICIHRKLILASRKKVSLKISKKKNV